MKQGKRKQQGTELKAKPQRKPQQQDIMVQLAQELYRVVLFAVFFLQTYAVGFVPWIGTKYSLCSICSRATSFNANRPQ